MTRAVVEGPDRIAPPTRATRRAKVSRRLQFWPALREFARAQPEVVVAIVGAWLARIVFWAMTNRMFEDGLTTITHARNAVEGLGLTHHTGEGHVHGFTSALSVLVPLVGEVVHPNGGGFVAIRLASLGAVAIAIYFAHLLGRELGLARWAMLFPLGYLAFDQNQIYYGMAGMETEIAVAILLASAYFVLRERMLISGFTFGLCILVRPDFVLWIVPAGCYLACRHRSDLLSLLRAAGVGGAVIAPWFVFTTFYYGSPIPNTIGAKIGRYLNPPSFSAGPGAWISFAWHQLQASGMSVWHGFAPFLEDGLLLRGPVSPWILGDIAFALIVLALAGAWWLRRAPKAWPLLAYAVIFVVYRILVLPPSYYEWYLGPFMAVIAIVAAAGLTAVTTRIGPRVGLIGSATLAFAFAVHMPFTFPLEARVQHNIEDRVRKQVGLWLHANVPSGESVVSESAGYMGWYGRVKLYDYPGLTSPTAYNALKRLGFARNNLFELIRAVNPDWIVLRPNERAALQEIFPQVAARYRTVREFSVGPRGVSLVHWHTELINIDTDFFVLRRIKPRGAAA